MTTLKLKRPARPAEPADPDKPYRAPVRGRGAGVHKRPTLAEAQARRAEQQRPPSRDADPKGARAPGRDPAAPRPSRPAPRDAVPTAQPPSRSPARPPSRSSGQAGGKKDAAPEPAQSGPAPRAPARPPGQAGQARGAQNTAFSPKFAPKASPKPAGSAGYARAAQTGAAARPAGRPPQGRHDSPARPASKGAPRTNRAASAFEQDHPEGSLRLSKRMSELGLASRREADEWIAKGWVRVDGRVASTLGARVQPEQLITIDARARMQQDGRVTVLLNKPVGYVSGQAEDGYKPAMVLVTAVNQWRDDRSGLRWQPGHLRSLVPAGRLDIDSVGLLVLTQDGRIAKTLIGEDNQVEKEYLVRVERIDGGALPEQDMALLRHGLELDGEALRPAQVEWVNDDQLRFVLKQGKKRQIRRMCEAVGLRVLGLKRVRIGRVMLGDLPPGTWRYLRGDEAFD